MNSSIHFYNRKYIKFGNKNNTMKIDWGTGVDGAMIDGQVNIGCPMSQSVHPEIQSQKEEKAWGQLYPHCGTFPMIALKTENLNLSIK